MIEGVKTIAVLLSLTAIACSQDEEVGLRPGYVYGKYKFSGDVGNPGWKHKDYRDVSWTNHGQVF